MANIDIKQPMRSKNHENDQFPITIACPCSPCHCPCPCLVTSLSPCYCHCPSLLPFTITCHHHPIAIALSPSPTNVSINFLNVSVGTWAWSIGTGAQSQDSEPIFFWLSYVNIFLLIKWFKLLSPVPMAIACHNCLLLLTITVSAIFLLWGWEYVDRSWEMGAWGHDHGAWGWEHADGTVRQFFSCCFIKTWLHDLSSHCHFCGDASYSLWWSVNFLFINFWLNNQPLPLHIIHFCPSVPFALTAFALTPSPIAIAHLPLPTLSLSLSPVAVIHHPSPLPFAVTRHHCPSAHPSTSPVNITVTVLTLLPITVSHRRHPSCLSPLCPPVHTNRCRCPLPLPITVSHSHCPSLLPFTIACPYCPSLWVWIFYMFLWGHEHGALGLERGARTVSQYFSGYLVSTFFCWSPVPMAIACHNRLLLLTITVSAIFLLWGWEYVDRSWEMGAWGHDHGAWGWEHADGTVRQFFSCCFM